MRDQVVAATNLLITRGARFTLSSREFIAYVENAESVKTLEESREIIFYRTCSLSIVLNCMCQTCKITRFTQCLWIVVL